MSLKVLLRLTESGQLREHPLFPILQGAGKAIFRFHNLVAEGKDHLRRRPKSRIGKDSRIAGTAWVDAFGVNIGDACIIGDGAVIYRDTILEDGVEIGPGAVIGSGGFDYRRFNDAILPIYPAGGVSIRRGASIGPHSVINRATFGGKTEIGAGTWIGAQSHIAHDVRIGAGCRILPCSMISGYTSVGDGARFGYGVAISDGLSIGDGAIIAQGSVITRDVPADKAVSIRI